MTFTMLLQCILEAEDRVKNFPNEEVRARSQETLDLLNERLRKEGLTREELERVVKAGS